MKRWYIKIFVFMLLHCCSLAIAFAEEEYPEYPMNQPMIEWIKPPATYEDLNFVLSKQMGHALKQFHIYTGKKNYPIEYNVNEERMGNGDSKNTELSVKMQKGKKKIEVNVSVHTEKMPCNGIAGYQVRYDFSESDLYISNIVHYVYQRLCVQPEPDGKFFKVSSTFIMTDGPNTDYFTRLGVMEVLGWQHWNLLKSIVDDANNRGRARAAIPSVNIAPLPANPPTGKKL